MYDYDREILGYDCDGNEIEEYRILRFPFSDSIEDWEIEPNVDPRIYCAIKGSDGEYYAVSAYDHWNTKYIRRYENLKEDEPVPMRVLPISAMENYEVAYSGVTGNYWYYEFDREKLKRK